MMKKFIKNFDVYILFILTQTVFLFVDYMYVNQGEPLKVHVNLFFITLIITIVTLSIRTIFETIILLGITKIFKKSMSLRENVKTLFKCMKYPVALSILFILIQILIIRNSASIFQIIANSSVNFLYMVLVCIYFKIREKNLPAFVLFTIYSASYAALQAYNVIMAI